MNLGIVHPQKAVIGRGYGDKIEIIQGRNEGSTILASAGDVSQEGTRIVPVASGGCTAAPIHIY